MKSLRVAWFFAALLFVPVIHAQEFQAGVGRADITPAEPIRLAGYASRNKPSESVEQHLFVKALALRDAAGATTLILTADTIGTPRWFNDQLAARIEKELQISRARFLFSCSHSHSTPVVHGCLEDMYGLQGQEADVVKRYSEFFLQKSFEAAQAALKDLAPAKLSFGRGNAAFAANRRFFGARGVQFGVNPTGVVNHEVPVLRVERGDGSLKSLLVGYACHCTTPGADYKVCGDWAGYAQEYLELTYPGATAMIVIGCGADQNPEPRTGHFFCRQHGLALAGAVARVLNNEPWTKLSGAIGAAFDRVELPLDKLPDKAYYETKAADKNPAIARYGKRYVGMLERGEKIMTSYPCPLQVLRIGTDLTLVAIGGEVCVDYSHRLRRELPNERLWVAGYCNDVFAYVPSMRILTEGGYEADFNLIYYGIPTRFAMTVEDTLVKKAVQLVQQAAPGGAGK
ncbi:MAG: neutral/alkaline non-lysosomal ceramidase N-terminal domain-containing protein [Verrucomicrobiota bacterium]